MTAAANELLTHQDDHKHQACTFYIMSFILDASIGLVVIWTLCKVISFCIKRFNWMDGVPFGKYQKDDMHFRLSLNQNQHRENEHEHETSDQENEMDDEDSDKKRT